MKSLTTFLTFTLLAVAADASAQASALHPENVQIAAAIAPLPEEFRAGATVYGYRAGEKQLVALRQGKGPYICLADDPQEAARFHVACYHGALEPFMLRGRQLRAAGITKPAAVDSARYAEIAAGTLAMPRTPSALYSLTGTPAHLDASTGGVTGARALYVVYIPFATAESTGLPATPSRTGPWIMFPGSPKAHIMFSHDM